MPRKRIVAIGILIILLIIYLPGYSKLQELKAKNIALLNRIEELKGQNLRLTQQIERLENDPFYIEKKARDKMGIGKKGEIIYKVVDNSEEPKTDE